MRIQSAKSRLHEGQELRLLKIRNPWGFAEWNGDWSDNSPLWNEELRSYFDVESTRDDGMFDMTLNDFNSYFDIANIFHVLYNSNVKSFKVTSDSIKVPQTFNLYITEPAEVSLSVVFKNGRFDPELKNKARNFTLLIANFNQDISTFSQVVVGLCTVSNRRFIHLLDIL